MKTFFYTLLLTLFTFLTGSGQSVQMGSLNVTGQQTNNPRSRTFVFHLPNNNAPVCNLPLLIALHGDGGTGTGMMNTTGFNTIADTQNFIVVYPNAESTAWGVQWNKYADDVAGYAAIPDANAADDIQFMADLIDYFYQNYGVDRSRVYATGHSGGGFMAYFLAIADNTKNKIAGIAPVAANLWGDNNYLNAQFGANFVSTAIYHIHSNNDGTVPFPGTTGWVWPLSSFSYPTCNNSSATSTNVNADISVHVFCGTGNKVIMTELKRAGLGHGYPTMANSGFDGSTEIWNFLKDFSKGSYAVMPGISPSSTTINTGQSVVLTASGCGNTGYLWSTGANTTSITVSPASTFNYTVACRSLVSQCQIGTTSAPAVVNVNNICPETDYVDGLVTPMFTPNQVIQAANYIIGGTLLNPLVIDTYNSNKLTLRAGKAIEIGPGFSIQQGAVVQAEIANCVSAPTPQTFFIQGKYLKDPCGNTVILKGVNKMNIWTDRTGASIPEIAQSGANCVRIVWTTTLNGQPTSDAELDALIAKCILYKMIPMVEIHDATCNLAALQIALDYWKRPAMLTIIDKYKHALLLNIANEPGDWQATATQFETTYKDAVTQLRNAGITVPLVIDGIDCGKNLEVIVQKGPSIINHDPLHNILFSVHTYWPMNNGATQPFITAQLEAANSAEIPFIVGELSKYGAYAGEGVSVCSAAGQVDYEWIAAECQRLGIGWLAWEWGPGNAGGGDPLCTIMDMTTNNTYATLTGWGLALATNNTYGLVTAQKTAYIQSGFTNCN